MIEICMTALLQQIEGMIRRDPAGRGLIASEPERGPLCPGHLADAARELTMHGRRVGIVTGFFIPHGEIPAAETDGPPGAVVLAAVLEAVGIEVTLITDEHCANAVNATAEFVGFTQESVHVVGDEGDLAAAAAEKYTHLIAVERVGPSHTLESISEQAGGDPALIARFATEVGEERRNRCHNMQGAVIDEHTAPLHELFETPSQEATQCQTVGIGDGGNEIGMGVIPWEELSERLPGEHAAVVPCRVATDWTILAGTSNWGAEALAGAVAALTGNVQVLAPYDCDFQERLLEHIVEHGPCVAGVTGRREPIVDGLPFITYIQPWAGIRRDSGIAGVATTSVAG